MSYSRSYTSKTTTTYGGGSSPSRVTKTTYSDSRGGGYNRTDRYGGSSGGSTSPRDYSSSSTRDYSTSSSPQDYSSRKGSNGGGGSDGGKYFEDDEFPCIDCSIFFSRRPPRPFVWKRPWEIVDDPQMFVGGASRLDIQQGMLGDCWLLAAIAALTQHPSLMNKVVPKDYVANKNDPKYKGSLTFSIWQYGVWVDVTIDDRLPTYNNKLVFVHSSEKNEFWSALLEKAYAKLNGSYEALKGGQTGEALEDFTGGLSESFELKKAPANLFSIMEKAEKRQALMGCSINARPNEIEAKMNNGLVKGHAYTVTGVRQVKAKTRRGDIDVQLVRIRNPWGNEREWKGAWSDRSSEWEMLSDYEKKSLGLVFEDDGEFWMSFDDFKAQYTTLEICMLGGDSAMQDKSKIAFNSRVEHGQWRRGLTAGGCRNFIQSFHKNPQFKITLQDSDDDQDDLCTVIIALMQKDRRKEKSKGQNMLTIGFSLYKLEEEKDKQGQLDRDFFQYHASTARSPVFINSREVVGRFELPPGEYCVIPTTFNPNEEGNFLLRMFSEKAQKSCEIDEKTSFKPEEDRRVKISKEQNDTLDAKFRDFFDSLAGRDGEIDANELQQILSTALKNDLAGKKFSLESARCIISMYDDDQSGMLSFPEFKQTWVQVKRWMSQFRQRDTDNSGELEAYELRSALKDEGFTLSNDVLMSLSARFTSGDGKINVDDYMEILCRLNVLSKCFQKHAGRSSKASFNLDEFIEMGLSL